MAQAKRFELFTPEGKGVIAELDDAGVVTFAIEAGEGSSIRGTEMFNRMMQHFGEEAQAIRGIWLKSPRGEVSSNIDKVNELTSAGMSREEAIRHAWTVTRAAKLGLRKVSVIGMPEGIPGNYTSINVLIER